MTHSRTGLVSWGSGIINEDCCGTNLSQRADPAKARKIKVTPIMSMPTRPAVFCSSSSYLVSARVWLAA